LPPAAVAQNAAQAGVALFCLTDHDTLAGHPDTCQPDFDGRMQVLRGLELSCGERGRPVHLLLLGLEAGPGLAQLEQEITRLQQRRRERIREICARFVRWNIHLDPDAIVAGAHGGSVGRPHVAAALLKAGVVRSLREAFDRFLRDGGPADIPGPRLTVEEGAALGKAAGARVSLAHPHTVGHPELVQALLVRTRDAGLEGIEAYYGPYPSRDRAAWRALGEKLGLAITGGSDFHASPRATDVAMGVELPDELVPRLRDWLNLPTIGPS
jgi:predicted metal-dependent phosphoesterase TrpH